MTDKPFGVVYGLYDSSGLRYIGQTSCALNRRLRQHLTVLRGKDHKTRWIKKLLAAGVKPHIQIITVASSAEELDRLEIAYIDNARDSGHALVNTLPGGQVNFRGMKHSIEAIAKMGWHRRGKKHTDDARAKISAARALQKFSPETLAKMSAVRKGIPKSAETRAKMSAARKQLWADPDFKVGVSAAMTKAWTPERRARLAARNRARSEGRGNG